MKILNRYSVINEKMPREILLLQGTGCLHKRCIYCDYYKDVSFDPFLENKKNLDKITGKTGVLDIINSGSAMELDESTINLIYKKIVDFKIHTIWFEAHWVYRKVLDKFRKKFPEILVKFRTGIETFNPELRNFWKKGIPDVVTPFDIAKYFNGVCLLVGIQDQSKEIVKKDIETALRYFEYFNINIFAENSTSVKKNSELINWFLKEIKPSLENNPRVEILINNKDLGVG